MNNLSDFEFKKIEFEKAVENKVVIVIFRPSIKENLKKMGRIHQLRVILEVKTMPRRQSEYI